MAKCVKCKSAPIPAEQADSCYKCLCQQQAEQIRKMKKLMDAKAVCASALFSTDSKIIKDLQAENQRLKDYINASLTSTRASD